MRRQLSVTEIHRSGLIVLGGRVAIRTLELVPIHRSDEARNDADAAVAGLERLIASLPAGAALQLRAQIVPVSAPDPQRGPVHAAIAASIAGDPLMPAASRLACHAILPLPRTRRGRAALESLVTAEHHRSAFGRLGFRPRLLDGGGSVRLLRRAVGAPAGAGEGDHLELLGSLEPEAERRLARDVASELASGIESLDLDLEQDRYVGHAAGPRRVIAFGAPERPIAGWPLGALRRDIPGVVSVHVRRGVDGDAVDLAVLCELSVPTGESATSALEARVDDVSRRMAREFGVRTQRGEYHQRALWMSCLPLALDPGARRRTTTAAVAALAAPVFDPSAGGSSGVPVGTSRATGTLESLELSGPDAPFLLIHGGPPAERALWAAVLANRLRAFDCEPRELDGEDPGVVVQARRSGSAVVLSVPEPGDWAAYATHIIEPQAQQHAAIFHSLARGRARVELWLSPAERQLALERAA